MKMILYVLCDVNASFEGDVGVKIFEKVHIFLKRVLIKFQSSAKHITMVL